MYLATLELFIAAAIWGFAFIAISWALKFWTPIQLIFLRNLIGATAGCFLVIFFERNWANWKTALRISFPPAIFLTVMLFFQSWGLQFTSVTKSSFITILYVVMVPFLEAVIERRWIPRSLLACVVIALYGMVLIVDLSSDFNFNSGDLLTLAAAFMAALHIISIDVATPKISNAFLFNVAQSVWGTAFSGVYLLATGSLPSGQADAQGIASILFMGLGATLIAFYFQVRAQKILSPTVVSLFFLLESPMAMGFAFFLIHETITAQSLFGASLIVCAATLAIFIEAKRKAGPLRIENARMAS